MSCQIHNNSGQDMSALTQMAKRFYPYAQEYLGFDKPATIVYESDPANAEDPLGKTAHYDPSSYTVTLYVDGRHPKDLLRSLAHELVHHTQNCRGDLTPEKLGEMGDGYAQTNGHLRKMEQEAYASMVMRDWEDQYKSKRRNNLNETTYSNKEYTTMSEHEQLIKRIVAEVLKEAALTNEAEEDAEVTTEAEEETVDEAAKGSRQGGDRAKKQCEQQGKKMVAGKCVELDEGTEADADAEVTTEGEDEEATNESVEATEETEALEESEEDETIEEGDEDTTDDLQETFRRRQEKLFERLVRWSKK